MPFSFQNTKTELKNLFSLRKKIQLFKIIDIFTTFFQIFTFYIKLEVFSISQSYEVWSLGKKAFAFVNCKSSVSIIRQPPVQSCYFLFDQN